MNQVHLEKEPTDPQIVVDLPMDLNALQGAREANLTPEIAEEASLPVIQKISEHYPMINSFLIEGSLEIGQELGGKKRISLIIYDQGKNVIFAKIEWLIKSDDQEMMHSAGIKSGLLQKKGMGKPLIEMRKMLAKRLGYSKIMVAITNSEFWSGIFANESGVPREIVRNILANPYDGNYKQFGNWRYDPENQPYIPFNNWVIEL